MKRIVSVLLTMIMVSLLAGCGSNGRVEETESTTETAAMPTTTQAAEETTAGEGNNFVISMDGLPGAVSGNTETIDASEETESAEQASEKSVLSDAFRQATSAFAIQLFQGSLKNDGNTMLSPVSVQAALALAANGAAGETLNQIQQVLAGGMELGEWNEEMTAWMANLSGEEVKLANSVWYRGEADWLTVQKAYLNEMHSVYDADNFAEDFTDPATEEKINAWVSEKTDGMIPRIINNLAENSDMAMLLINALAFDAEWGKPYLPVDVQDGIFTKEDGSTEEIQMMGSDETWYLTDEKATGFIKDYKGGYRFVALLPNEGVSVGEYVSGLTGEHFLEILENAEQTPVTAAMPKFTSEYEVSLEEVLSKMGIKDAFDNTMANFSRMGECTDGRNLSIGQVLHKTMIEVTETGTKAAAATTVDIMATGLAPDINRVICDRPYVYAVIEAESNLPIFIGTVMEVNE